MEGVICVCVFCFLQPWVFSWPACFAPLSLKCASPFLILRVCTVVIAKLFEEHIQKFTMGELQTFLRQRFTVTVSFLGSLY